MIERFIAWRLKRAIRNNNLKNLNWWLKILGADTLSDEQWPAYGNIDYAALFQQCLKKTSSARLDILSQQDALKALQDIFLDKLKRSKEENTAMEDSFFLHKPAIDFQSFKQPLGSVSRFFSRVMKFLFSSKIKPQRFSAPDIERLIQAQYPVRAIEGSKKIARENITEHQYIQDLFSTKSIDYQALAGFPNHQDMQPTLMEIHHDVVVEQDEVAHMDEAVIEEAVLEVAKQVNFKREQFFAIDRLTLIRQIQNTGYTFGIGWVDGMERGVQAKYQQATIEISTRAGEQISNAKNALNSYICTVEDMDNLPAGFFWIIPEDTSSQCVIRLDYSAEKHQLDLENAKKSGRPIVDLLSVKKPERFGFDIIYKKTTETSEKIKKVYPKLTFNLSSFLIEARKDFRSHESLVIDNFLWYACDSLSEASFIKTTELLLKLEKIRGKVGYFKEEKSAAYSVLRTFFHLLKTPKVFDAESVDLLEAFSSLSPEEIMFFAHYCETSTSGAHTAEFKINLQKYLSLIKLLHTHGLSVDALPEFDFSNGLLFISQLTNFLYGIENPIVQADVLKNFKRIPTDLGLASTWLKTGYQFVDQEMLCGVYGGKYSSYYLHALCEKLKVHPTFIDQASAEKLIEALSGEPHVFNDPYKGNTAAERITTYQKAILLRYLALNTTFSQQEALDLLKEVSTLSLTEFFVRANARLKIGSKDPDSDGNPPIFK